LATDLEREESTGHRVEHAPLRITLQQCGEWLQLRPAWSNSNFGSVDIILDYNHGINEEERRRKRQRKQ